MSTPQKKAIANHRKRQSEKGNVRMEINVPQNDREMLSSLASILRAGGIDADRVRMVLGSALKGEELINFKQLLELAPLDGVDLERSRDTGLRDSEF